MKSILTSDQDSKPSWPIRKHSCCNPFRSGRAVLKLVLTFIGVLSVAGSSLAEEAAWTLRANEVVAILGGTNAVNLQNEGYFETLLTIENADGRPRFIDMAWEGDTVYRQGTVIERWREEKFGDLAKQLKDNQVTSVFLLFGQNEALDGLRRLDAFVADFESMVATCKQEARRVTIVSPIPFEKADDLQPDLTKRNDDLAAYVAAMKNLADKHECVFIDLFSVFSKRNEKLTSNGFHISIDGHRIVAKAMFSKGVSRSETIRVDDSLRAAVSQKHRLWMNYWRPANWKCLYGDDGKREFGKATAGGLTLREEWSQLPEMISQSEKEIWAIAAKLATKSTLTAKDSK